WRFVKWFTGPAGQAIWSRSGLRVPTILDANLMNEIASLTEHNFSSIFAQVFAGDLYLGPEWGPGWTQINPMMDGLVKRVIAGDMPAAAAAAEISTLGTAFAQEELARWQQ